MIHPDTEVKYINHVVGSGVVARAQIPKGTITWVRDGLDRTFSPKEIAVYDEKHRDVLDRYSYRNREGDYVFCWDHTRFMNHSFFPTCLPTPYGFEICVRDVEPGEELTNDYGCLNIIEEFTPFDEGHPRKSVRPDDLLHYAGEWDEQVRRAFHWMFAVDQPLMPWLTEESLELLRDISLGLKKPASVRELFFDPER